MKCDKSVKNERSKECKPQLSSVGFEPYKNHNYFIEIKKKWKFIITSPRQFVSQTLHQLFW